MKLLKWERQSNFRRLDTGSGNSCSPQPLCKTTHTSCNTVMGLSNDMHWSLTVGHPRSKGQGHKADVNRGCMIQRNMSIKYQHYKDVSSIVSKLLALRSLNHTDRGRSTTICTPIYLILTISLQSQPYYCMFKLGLIIATLQIQLNYLSNSLCISENKTYLATKTLTVDFKT